MFEYGSAILEGTINEEKSDAKEIIKKAVSYGSLKAKLKIIEEDL